jgi:hypothetical protein
LLCHYTDCNLLLHATLHAYCTLYYTITTAKSAKLQQPVNYTSRSLLKASAIAAPAFTMHGAALTADSTQVQSGRTNDLNFGTAATVNRTAVAAVELTASERAAVWSNFSARSLSQAELAAVAEIQLRRSTTRDGGSTVYSSSKKKGMLLQGAGVRGDDVEAALALMADQVRWSPSFFLSIVVVAVVDSTVNRHYVMQVLFSGQ